MSALPSTTPAASPPPSARVAKAAQRWADLDRLRRNSAMYDAVIDEIDGRQIRIGDHWLADFASCNYLGFDLDPEIMDSIEPLVRTWGTHPSWSRLLGNPRPYLEIEEQLTELLGAEDTLALPTITHIHTSVIPVLVGEGTVFMDAQAHKTIYDGCAIARGRGATLTRFAANDPWALEQELKVADRNGPFVVAMDGVNSMTGNAPDLVEFARICREHDALLYVDDAHGFGVIGEDPTDESPYGSRGNSIVRYFDESYENVILVGGFSKAYSSLMAFMALPTHFKNLLKVAAPPYLYSGPSPVASLATVLAGLDVNERRGDALRGDLAAMTGRILDALDRLGVATPNHSGFPIIEVPLSDHRRIAEVGQELFDRGVYATLAAFPLVPKAEVGFRLQVTAANTEAEIDLAIDALEALAAQGDLRAADAEPLAGLETARS
jgi:8-amino-7-oxononanoate synthase